MTSCPGFVEPGPGCLYSGSSHTALWLYDSLNLEASNLHKMGRFLFYTLWYRQGHTYFPYIFLSLVSFSLAYLFSAKPQKCPLLSLSLSLSLSKCLSNVQPFTTPWTVTHTAPCPLTTVFSFFGCAGFLLLPGLFSSCGKWGLLFSCSAQASHCSGFSCCGAWALRARASVSVAPRLWSTGSVVVAHRLSCSKVCGIFPDQEWNPCLLHWQVDSLPLSHQGSPPSFFWNLHSVAGKHLWVLVFPYSFPPSSLPSPTSPWWGRVPGKWVLIP